MFIKNDRPENVCLKKINSNMEQKSILIVDDQAFIRHILGAELKRAGFQVFFAENGKEALQSVQEFKPSLVLLDIMMPVMDGYETCKKLRENQSSSNIPIIFLSANNQKEAVITAMQSGGNDFVVKSPNSIVLLQKINKILGKNN